MKTNNMTRTEAYNAIKNMGLQNECVKKFGKNFTMCKTADLIALVEENKDSKEEVPATPKAETKKEEKMEAPVNTHVTFISNGSVCVDVVARAAISKLVEILENNGAIDDYEKEEVLDILGDKIEVSGASSEEYKPKSDSPYSDNEIDAMFNDMGI